MDDETTDDQGSQSASSSNSESSPSSHRESSSSSNSGSTPSSHQETPSRGRAPTERGRLAKGWAILTFGWYRVWRQFRYTAPRRTLVTVSIVAITVVLLLVATGIAVELAADSDIEADTDLRIVPEGGGSLSAVVDVEGPRLGNAHPASEQLEAHDGVETATPMYVDIVQMRTADAEDTQTILAIGVISGPDAPAIAGIDATALEAGDPYYADGSYDGTYTGEVVLSEAAATQMEAAESDRLVLERTDEQLGDTHSVTAIEEAQPGSGFPAALPIAVFQLSELQAVTGGDDGDLATQILVETTDDPDTVAESLEMQYDDVTVIVESGQESPIETIQDDSLAMGLGVASFVIAITLTTLFVSTTMGLAIEADKRHLATLDALGFASRSRLVLVSISILALTTVGALGGVVLGVAGIWLINVVAQATVTANPVATVGYWAIPYALVVSLVASLFAVPYPLAIASRTDTITALTRA